MFIRLFRFVMLVDSPFFYFSLFFSVLLVDSPSSELFFFFFFSCSWSGTSPRFLCLGGVSRAARVWGSFVRSFAKTSTMKKKSRV